MSSRSDDISDEFVFDFYNNRVCKTEILKLWNSTEPSDRTILNYFIRKAIEYDCSEVFEILFENGYQIHVMNIEGQTAMHLAFYNEEHRIKGRQQAQRTSWTPVNYRFYPSKVANLFINQWLLKYSDSLDYKDSYGLSYLHIACFMGNIELVKKYLTGDNVNILFSHSESLYVNFTPLHFAIINNTSDNLNIINYLLNHGANVDAHDLKGRTPLHLACSLFHKPINIRSEYLQYIPEEGSLQEIDWDCLSISSSKSLGILKVLLEHQSDIEFKDKNGNTPLLSIFPDNYYELSRLNEYWYYDHDHHDVPMDETVIKFAYLVKVGADVSAKNQQGNTVLHLIAKHLKMWRHSLEYRDLALEFIDLEHVRLVDQVFAVKEDFDVNSQNQDGETPLQIAFNYMSCDVVENLLNKKADLNGLKITWAGKELFEYYDSVPNFYMIRSLMAIINLFDSKGSDMSPAAHLFILKFLIHNHMKCKCTQNLYDLLHFGSVTHVIHILTETYKTSGPINFAPNYIDYYLPAIEQGGFYVDKSVRKLISKVREKKSPRYSESCKSSLIKELEIMKSIKLQNNMSLFDIMAQHPYDIPQYVLANFDVMSDEFLNIICQFVEYSDIITGHLIKSIVRQYIWKYGLESIEYLCPLLPTICYKIVLRYLSNTDIVNMYSVTITTNANETRFFI